MALPYTSIHLVVEEGCHTREELCHKAYLVVEEVCDQRAERVLLPLAFPPFCFFNFLELEIELNASYTSS